MALILTTLNLKVWSKVWHGCPEMENLYHGGVWQKHPKHIKGFEGLKLLINDTDQVSKAFLYMTEFLSSANIDLKTTSTNFTAVLWEDLKCSAGTNVIHLYVLTHFFCCGISPDTAFHVVEQVVLDRMWGILECFALRISDGEKQDKKDTWRSLVIFETQLAHYYAIRLNRFLLYWIIVREKY